VSTNYAALACADFPLCQGKLWPAQDAANGFDLTREMGKTDSGENLSLQALTAIHLAHRSFAYVVLAVVGWFAWRLHAARVFGMWPALVLGALVLQIVIGISTVLFNQPLLLAVAHNGGAALLLGVTLIARYKISTFNLLRPAATVFGKR
jgi:heme a synthase